MSSAEKRYLSLRWELLKKEKEYAKKKNLPLGKAVFNGFSIVNKEGISYIQYITNVENIGGCHSISMDLVKAICDEAEKLFKKDINKNYCSMGVLGKGELA